VTGIPLRVVAEPEELSAMLERLCRLAKRLGSSRGRGNPEHGAESLMAIETPKNAGMVEQGVSLQAFSKAAGATLHIGAHDLDIEGGGRAVGRQGDSAVRDDEGTGHAARSLHRLKAVSEC
jgi:hypothetical protein